MKLFKKKKDNYFVCLKVLLNKNKIQTTYKDFSVKEIVLMNNSKVFAIFVLFFVYMIITINIKYESVIHIINISKYPLPLLTNEIFQNEVRLL